MRKLTYVAGALLALAFTGSAFAESNGKFDYNYVQGTYDYANTDQALPQHGVSAAGSYEVLQQVVVSAGTQELWKDAAHTNITKLGIGTYFPISANVDIFGNINAVRINDRRYVNSSDNSSQWGASAEVGARLLLSDQLEAAISVERYRINQPVGLDKNYNVGKASLVYHVSSPVSIVLSAGKGSDGRVFSGGVRYSF